MTDPGPGFEPGGHGPRADGGYGLHLLDRLATRWGVAGAEPVTVWVELERSRLGGRHAVEQVGHDPRGRAPDRGAPPTS